MSGATQRVGRHLCERARCQIIGNTLIGNNSANSSAHAAIYFNDNNNRIENNQISSSGAAGAGIAGGAGYTGNLIIKNSAAGNGVRGNLHVRFSGVGVAATPLPYRTGFDGFLKGIEPSLRQICQFGRG